MLAAAVADGADDFSTVVTMRPRHLDPVKVEIAAILRREETTNQLEITWVMLTGTTIAKLSHAPLTTNRKAEVLGVVAHTCGEAFDPPVAVSITVGRPAEPEFIASDSPIAQTVDAAQMTTGEGPCQTALGCVGDRIHRGCAPRLPLARPSAAAGRQSSALYSPGRKSIRPKA